MQIRIDQAGSSLSLAGRLSAANVAEVRMALAAAITAGDGDLFVDLSGVELVDATGLGVLVATHRLAHREGRRLVLRGVPDRMERLLAITRLHRVLAVERSVPV